MECHPQRIRKMPEYEEFRNLKPRQQNAKIYKDKGIFRVHPACNHECVYWKECLNEVNQRSKGYKKHKRYEQKKGKAD
jgi:hypothetical protein